MMRYLTLLCFIFLTTSCSRNPEQLVAVTNEDDGTVSIFRTNDSKTIAVIAVGHRPRGICLSRDGKKLFVAVTGSPKCPPGMPDSVCAAMPSDKSQDGVAE